MADSIDQRIFSESFANLEGIIHNPAFKRAEKLRSVQKFQHHYRDDKEWVNQTTEETILFRTLSGDINTGDGELGNHLNELRIRLIWVLVGGEIEESDFGEIRHDVEKALWTPGDALDYLHRPGGMRAGWSIFVAGDEFTTDGVLYDISVTYSTELGDPTRKGI